MNYTSISEIFEANAAVRAKLHETLSAISEEEANARPDGEKWSIAQIVEHISMVENGMVRICTKLLSKAEQSGQLSDGTLSLEEFAQKAAGITDIKLEAPEIVHPNAGRTIAQSLEALEQTSQAFRDIKPLFERFDANSNKYPHPYLGDLSALEWLALAGGHEARHLRQIKLLLPRVRQEA